jgi:hypothetical protein
MIEDTCERQLTANFSHQTENVANLIIRCHGEIMISIEFLFHPLQKQTHCPPFECVIVDANNHSHQFYFPHLNIASGFGAKLG